MRRPVEFDGFPDGLQGKVPYLYRGIVQRVIDGDTYDLLLDVGFNSYLYQAIRLRGVNCPERNTPEGQAAKAYVTKLLQGQPCLVRTWKDRITFGRYVADIELANDVDLAALLVAVGHAKVM